jgi:hypothetical protein
VTPPRPTARPGRRGDARSRSCPEGTSAAPATSIVVHRRWGIRPTSTPSGTADATKIPSVASCVCDGRGPSSSDLTTPPGAAPSSATDGMQLNAHLLARRWLRP